MTFVTGRRWRPRGTFTASVMLCSTTGGKGDFFFFTFTFYFHYSVQCFRGMIERDRDIEERRVNEMAEKLSVYKREVKYRSIINHELSFINTSKTINNQSLIYYIIN